MLSCTEADDTTRRRKAVTGKVCTGQAPAEDQREAQGHQPLDTVEAACSPMNSQLTEPAKRDTVTGVLGRAAQHQGSLSASSRPGRTCSVPAVTAL